MAQIESPYSDFEMRYLARQIEKAEARQIADDSALLPQLAESLIQEAQSSDGKIPFDVEVELAAIHNDVSAISNDHDAEPIPGDLDSQFNLQAEALGLDITHNEELDAAQDEELEVADPFSDDDSADDDSAEIELSEEDTEADEVADEQLENELFTQNGDEGIDGDEDDEETLPEVDVGEVEEGRRVATDDEQEGDSENIDQVE